MGDNRILELKEHLIALIKKVDDPKESEHIHTLCHSLELVLQCEHMGRTIGHIKEPDFPDNFFD